MFFVMLSWFAQLLLWSGIGWLIYARLFRLNSGEGWCARDFFHSCWTGFGALVAVAQIYALFFPIKGLFLVMAAGAAAPGLWLQFRAWRRRPTGTPTSARWQVLLFWTLLMLCALRLGAGLGWLEWTGAYDSDLYHFGIVRWAKEYPTVPGLANLHAPLGFNSTYLLYAAIVDHGLWYREAAWVVPGVFVILFTAQLLWTLLCDHAALRRTKIFSLLLLAFAALLICDTIPCLYYDRPAALFLCLALLELSQLAPATAARQEMLRSLFMILLLVAVSVSIKPIAFAAAALLGAWALWLTWRWTPRWLWLRLWLFPVLLAGGMLTRNVVLSGWLFYPTPYGRLPVQWAMPTQLDPDVPDKAMHSVSAGYLMARAWARLPGPAHKQALAGGPWLQLWWQRNCHAMEIKLLAGGLLCLVLALLVGQRREPPGWLPYAALVSGTVVLLWFLAAPDLRFGEGFIWLWFAVTGAWLLTRWPASHWTLAAAGALALTALLLAQPHWHWPEKTGWWNIGQAHEAHYHRVTLNNGQQPPLTVLAPDHDDRMGDAPLPHTPYPFDGISCRVPGSLRHGFFIALPATQP